MYNINIYNANIYIYIYIISQEEDICVSMSHISVSSKPLI